MSWTGQLLARGRETPTASPRVQSSCAAAQHGPDADQPSKGEHRHEETILRHVRARRQRTAAERCGSRSGRPRPRRPARRPASLPCPARRTRPGQGAPYLSTVGAPRKLAGAGIGAVGGALGRVALAAGAKAGNLAGKKVKPLKLRIGYLDIIGGIESADRAHNSLRVAFKQLGAKWIYCDGQGTPTKWATCGNSLLAQNIDVLALTGIDPSTIPSVVQAAKAKKVPIVDFGGHRRPGLCGPVRAQRDQEREDPRRLPEGEARLAVGRLQYRHDRHIRPRGRSSGQPSSSRWSRRTAPR